MEFSRRATALVAGAGQGSGTVARARPSCEVRTTLDGHTRSSNADPPDHPARRPTSSRNIDKLGRTPMGRVIIRAVNLRKEFSRPRRQKGRLGGLRTLMARQYDITIAVDDVSFEVAEGELVGYLGPNGAG